MQGLSNALGSIRIFLEKYTLYKSNNITVSFKDIGYYPSNNILNIEHPDRIITEQDKEIIINYLKRRFPVYCQSVEITLRELETIYAKSWLEYERFLDKTIKIKSLKKEWKKMQEWRGKRWGAKKLFFEDAIILPIHLRSWNSIEKYYKNYCHPKGDFWYWELYWVDWVLTMHMEYTEGFNTEKIRHYLDYEVKRQEWLFKFR